MAKKIESILELTGQDAFDFKNYMASPVYTARGREMLEKAWAMSIADEKCDRRKADKP
jgi:hypothetical protein